MPSYKFTPLAATDFEQILSYIAADNLTAAERLKEESKSVLSRLAEMPETGHVRKDLTDKDVRFWRFYSYLVVYDPKSKPLSIIRVISGFRDVKELLGDESV